MSDTEYQCDETSELLKKFESRRDAFWKTITPEQQQEIGEIMEMDRELADRETG